MSAFGESHPSSSPQPEQPPLVCPEDVDWIFDVDTLESAGSDGLIRLHGLEEASRENPHHPFVLCANSANIWDQALRHLSMASGEKHLMVSAHSLKEGRDLIFYARVAGFREQGLPRIAATFQRIDESSYQSVSDNTQQNWLYLLHEIKNPLSILKSATEIQEIDGGGEAAVREAEMTRQFAITCLEGHLRNGVFLATEDSRSLPNHPAPLDIKSFLEDLENSFQVLLKAENNHLELDLDVDAHQVLRLDRTLLSQLLNNILLNKISLLRNDTISLGASIAESKDGGRGKMLVLTIEDTGPAFPESVLQEVESEPDVEGLLHIHKHSGLGLPICRRIVSMMEGELRFFNDPPKTRVLICLPIG